VKAIADHRQITDMISEAALLERVRDLARLHGWRTYHPLRSKGSEAGWPDLSLCRNGRLIFAELKTSSGQLTHHQRAWISELERVDRIEVYVWRPGNWQTIQEVLR